MTSFKMGAIVLMALAGSAMLAAGTAAAKADITTDLPVEETYFLGETLSTAGATVDVGGKKFAAESVLFRPDGRAFSAEEYLLDELGRYTLVLRSEQDGTRQVRRSFIVGESIASFSQNGASYELGNRGLTVSLNEGNELTVNRTVDISQATAEDEIVSISVDPEAAGTADFTKILVTLTDVEDEDVYLRVLLQASNDNHGASYALAGANDQALTGYEAEWDRVHKNNQYGAFIPFTFYGEGGNSEFGIRYDRETKEVYAMRGHRIIDLDEPLYFPNKWQGFKSGKVRVSVECSSLLNDLAHITVRSLMGRRLEGDFSADDTPPVLTLEETGELPYAVVGRPFRLLPCSATDDSSGQVAVHTEVWYRYGYSNGYHVDSLGGSFTPDREGIYTIVYAAEDAFGNRATLTAPIDARTEEIPLTISLSGEKTAEGEIGREYAISDHHVEGGSGTPSVRVEAVLGEETVELDGAFLPERAGTWTIRYTATDYIGSTATVSYPFEAKAAEEPLFLEEPTLPRYLIAGKAYAFDAPRTADYTSGTRVDGMSDIYLKAGGMRQKISAGVPVTIDGTGTAELEYVCGSASLTRRIPIVTVEKDGVLDMGKYFDTTARKSVERDGVHFEADLPAQVTFIRELLAEGLTARFDAGSYGANELTLVLTDYADSTRALTLLIAAQGDGYSLRVNGVSVCAGTDIGFTAQSLSNEFNLLYEDGGISVDGVMKYDLSDLIGFEGFPSGRVYLDFRFGKADGGTLVIKNINSQPTNSVTADRIRPRIVVLGDYGGEKQLGETVRLAGADALDVLDPTLKFTLTVTDPDGALVTDAEGRKLENVDARAEYSFTVEKYGNYRVVYTASDSRQSASFTYIVPVEDKIAPTVEFLSQMQAEYAAGSRIALPDYSASDNCGMEGATVSRYLMTPFGRNIVLSADTKAVTLTERGVYRYCVVVCDAAGNMQMRTIEFRVR